MMEYSKLSDAEINARVGEALGWNAKSIHPDDSVTFRDDLGRLRGRKNYCNNAADAWPIIQNSGISLVYDGDDWLALHFSRTSLTYPNDHRKHPDKPFRAALILWLMMQESE